MRKIILLCTILALMPLSALATIINVPGDQTTIQDAIDVAAQSGDTVLLAENTYTDTGNYNIDFNGKDITVKSANGSGSCIIDCEQNGRAFLLEHGETITLEELTIKNGNYVVGGAIYAGTGTDLTVENCIFIDNTATNNGGAVHSLKSTFTECIFTNNNTTAGDGGAVYSYPGTTIFTGCTFSDNSASRGGAVHSTYSTFVNCTFTDNSASNEGAAIWTISSTITKSIFTGNSASNPDNSITTKGTIYSFSSTLTNCLFSNNSASCGGAIFYPSSSSPTSASSHNSTLTNCTLTLNAATVQGGAIWCDLDPVDPVGTDESAKTEDTIIIKNCILWDNTAAPQDAKAEIYEENEGNGSLEITYSDITDTDYSGIELSYNINNDPLFFGAVNDDLHIQIGSPCLNAGTSVGAPADDIDDNQRPSGGGFDIGAYERQSTIIINRLEGTLATTGNPPLDITFFCEASDNTVPITSYDWDIDGSPATGKAYPGPPAGSTISNIFNTIGTHYVTCTVHNQVGDVTSQTIVVNVVSVNTAPTANAGLDQIVAGCSVDLDGSGSSDSDGIIVSWSWDLHFIGDQCDNPSSGTDNDQTTTGEMPTVTGLIHGHYIVTLTVTDDAGADSTSNNNTTDEKMFLSVAADSTCDTNCGEVVQEDANGDKIIVGPLVILGSLAIL